MRHYIDGKRNSNALKKSTKTKPSKTKKEIESEKRSLQDEREVNISTPNAEAQVILEDVVEDVSFLEQGKSEELSKESTQETEAILHEEGQTNAREEDIREERQVVDVYDVNNSKEQEMVNSENQEVIILSESDVLERCIQDIAKIAGVNLEDKDDEISGKFDRITGHLRESFMANPQEAARALLLSLALHGGVMPNRPQKYEKHTLGHVMYILEDLKNSGANSDAITFLYMAVNNICLASGLSYSDVVDFRKIKGVVEKFTLEILKSVKSEQPILVRRLLPDSYLETTSKSVGKAVKMLESASVADNAREFMSVKDNDIVRTLLFSSEKNAASEALKRSTEYLEAISSGAMFSLSKVTADWKK